MTPYTNPIIIRFLSRLNPNIDWDYELRQSKDPLPMIKRRCWIDQSLNQITQKDALMRYYDVVSMFKDYDLHQPIDILIAPCPSSKLEEYWTQYLSTIHSYLSLRHIPHTFTTHPRMHSYMCDAMWLLAEPKTWTYLRLMSPRHQIRHMFMGLDYDLIDDETLKMIRDIYIYVNSD